MAKTFRVNFRVMLLFELLESFYHVFHCLTFGRFLEHKNERFMHFAFGVMIYVGVFVLVLVFVLINVLEPDES